MIRDNWANAAEPANADVWYNALSEYLSTPTASNYCLRITGARAKFYENRLWHCPSKMLPSSANTDNSPYFSLSMNSKLIQNPIQNEECSITMGTILQPSDTVSFQDARINPRERMVHPVQERFNAALGQPSTYASRFAARHDRGGNLGFCDGSVRWHLGEEVVETSEESIDVGRAIWPDGQIIWRPDPLDYPNVRGE